jgi:SAM-dependent methyltransferase
MWAVLATPEKKGNRWDADEFFATGIADVARVMHWIDEIGIARPRGRALDFGCGVGRLTQALAGHFDEVWGVDIAPSMIDGARRLDRTGGRCRYVVNATADLASFEDASFTFILSLIVLQHLDPDYIRGYLREFVRLLAPGGVLVFQLPAEWVPTRPAEQRRPTWRRVLRAVVPGVASRWIGLSGRRSPSRRGREPRCTRSAGNRWKASSSRRAAGCKPSARTMPPARTGPVSATASSGRTDRLPS